MSSKMKAPPLRRQSSADQGKALFTLAIKSSFFVISSKQLAQNSDKKTLFSCSGRPQQRDGVCICGTPWAHHWGHNCTTSNKVVESRWAFVRAMYSLQFQSTDLRTKLLGVLQSTDLLRDIAYNAFGSAAGPSAAESWFYGFQSMFRYDESTSRLVYSAKCTVEKKCCALCRYAEVAWECRWWDYLFDGLDPSELECHRCWELWLNCPTCADCNGRWTPSDNWELMRDCKRCRRLICDFDEQYGHRHSERPFEFFENKSHFRYNEKRTTQCRNQCLGKFQRRQQKRRSSGKQKTSDWRRKTGGSRKRSKRRKQKAIMRGNSGK